MNARELGVRVFYVGQSKGGGGGGVCSAQAKVNEHSNKMGMASDHLCEPVSNCI